MSGLALVTIALMGLMGSVTAYGAVSPIGARVEVSGGTIEGIVDSDGLKRYLGVPYAAPPVGALRWAPTAPLPEWSGVRAAKAYSPQCVQVDQLNAFYATRRDRQSEDCLYLNVWTRAESVDANLPVMVWVHGGALLEGSGELYPGAGLTARGVVLVTINYRLGPLGFFAHPELTAQYGSSGNQGFHDQIAALEWVRDNISRFGGDADNVTIFGESAGSWSMSVLQASPLARGLFHKVIGQSGARLLPQWHLREATPYAPSAHRWGERLAAVFAGRDKPDLASLRSLPARSIVEAYQGDSELLWNLDSLAIVDGVLLPQSVFELFSAGKQADVPVLLGSNANEAITFEPSALQPGADEKTNYFSLLEAVGKSLPGADSWRSELYPASTQEEAKAAYVALQTDMQFTQPMRQWGDLMMHVSSPAYLYWWNWDPELRGGAELGAFHAAEIPYVFGTVGDKQFGFIVEDLPRECLFSDLMMTIWTNFARFGDPSVEGTIEWPRYSSATQPMVVLGPEVVIKHGIRSTQVSAIQKSVDRLRRGR